MYRVCDVYGIFHLDKIFLPLPDFAFIYTDKLPQSFSLYASTHDRPVPTKLPKVPLQVR